MADYALPSSYPDDIEGATGNTFVYDKIGNLVTDNKENTAFLWNVYGKMQSATKAGIATTFGYDPQQNRFKKSTPSGSDFYIRDAQGNVLAIYQKKDGTFVWKEQHLYGSSRLGIFKPEVNIKGTYVLDVAALQQGTRAYELTNHLGNVLSTITDKGVITSAQDYYPFGLTLASRSFTEGGSSYRFGFNGKENDKELKQQDYGMRIYRPDLGRFLSVDPIGRYFPELTPYQFASNSPIQAIDLDGLEGTRPSAAPRTTPIIRRQVGGRTRQKTAEEMGIPITPQPARNVSNGRIEPIVEYDIDGKPTHINYGEQTMPQNLEIRDPKNPKSTSSPSLQAFQKANYEHLQDQIAVESRAAQLDDQTWGDEKNGQLIYVTYTRTNPKTGKVYIGRTRGYGTPDEVIKARYSGDKDKDNEGFDAAVRDKVEKATLSLANRHGDPSYQAIRGREQLLIEALGGPTGRDGSKSAKTKSANKINGVDPTNKTEYTLYTTQSIIKHGNPKLK